MMTIDVNIIMASVLVLLLLVFIRMSWTLKDIHEALLMRSGAETKVKVDFAGMNMEKKTVAEEEAQIDETEIAAVIAVASAAMRRGV